MSYLLDTNVVSELRKRERCHPGVRSWFDSVDDSELFLSVLVVGEIRRGIEIIRRRDDTSARALSRWLSALRKTYANRILPVTAEISDHWGRLCPDQPLSPIDGLLSATALCHDLTLVTRNVVDVARTGADILNPFSSRS